VSKKITPGESEVYNDDSLSARGTRCGDPAGIVLRLLHQLVGVPLDSKVLEGLTAPQIGVLQVDGVEPIHFARLIVLFHVEPEIEGVLLTPQQLQ